MSSIIFENNTSTKTGKPDREFATFQLILYKAKIMLSKFLNYFFRRNLFFFTFLSAIILTSCEEIPTEKIDNSIDAYSIIDVEAPSSFIYSSEDSSVTIHAAVDNPEPIERIYADVVSLESNFTLVSNVQLLDGGDQRLNGDLTAGDKIYSGTFLVPKAVPTGEYEIQFFVQTKNLEGQFVAAKLILLSSGQQNVPPIISNLQAPDTLIAPELEVNLSIDVTDANSLVGAEVYFMVTRPDGTSNGNKFLMFDDGDKEAHGDDKANDGTYSLIVQLPSDTNKGTYRFDFQAEDNAGALSNIISHNIVIK